MIWITPRTYITPKSKGLVVIHSDDGKLGDWTWLYPLCVNISFEYSQFHPFNLAKFCPAICSKLVNNAETYMTKEQVQKLATWTEIMTHGQYHVSLGRHNLTQNVNAGDTRFYCSAPGYLALYANFPYTYKITDGVNSENVKITARDTTLVTSGYVDIETPLVNSYLSDSSYVQLSDESMEADIKGCKDTLLEWGIEAKNHVFTNHLGSDGFYNPDAVAYIATLFDGARGRLVNEVMTGQDEDFDIYNQKGGSDGTISDTATIDGLLDQIQVNDGVFIFYTHSSTSAVLEHLIRECLDRGIRIVTQSEANAHLLEQANI